MKVRSFAVFTALSAVALLSTLPAGVATAAKPATPAPAAPKNAFQDDFLKLLDDVEKKIMSLEEAVPQDKFKWRPAPGVRSISEAYLHIAFGNYTFTKIATGKEPPADSGYAGDRGKWDTRTTDKAEIKKILDQSFTNVRAAVKALPDADLEKKVSFFGHDMTARAVLMSLIGHLNEHLGQSVAYARANNVVPPWSKG